MVDEDNPHNIYRDPSHRPENEDISVASNDGSKDGPLADDPPPLLDVYGRPIVEADDRTAAPPGAVPPGTEPHETAEDAVQPLPVAARAGGVHAGAEEEAPQPPPPPVEALPGPPDCRSWLPRPLNSHLGRRGRSGRLPARPPPLRYRPARSQTRAYRSRPRGRLGYPPGKLPRSGGNRLRSQRGRCDPRRGAGRRCTTS